MKWIALYSKETNHNEFGWRKKKRKYLNNVFGKTEMFKHWSNLVVEKMLIDSLSYNIIEMYQL